MHSCLCNICRFKALPSGTHFYHSHSALQRADGLHGAFIVREPQSEDPHGDLYDFDLEDHVIMLSDWLVKMARSRHTGHHHSDEDNKPASALINGIPPRRSHFFCKVAKRDSKV